VEADDWAALALLYVVEPQAVDLRIVRLEDVAGQALEALVRGAKDVHQRSLLNGFSIRARPPAAAHISRSGLRPSLQR
jgi:hypothetical protein